MLEKTQCILHATEGENVVSTVSADVYDAVVQPALKAAGIAAPASDELSGRTDKTFVGFPERNTVARPAVVRGRRGRRGRQQGDAMAEIAKTLQVLAARLK